MFGTFLFGLGLLGCGIAIGWQIKAAVFAAKDWDVLRWDNKSFAFKRLRPGTTIYRNEKVMLACKVNTEDIEEGGIVID